MQLKIENWDDNANCQVYLFLMVMFYYYHMGANCWLKVRFFGKQYSAQKKTARLNQLEEPS